MNMPDARRDIMLERLADYILAHGLSASSLRPLAKAVQTSDRMLLYYFGDKAALIEAALQVVASRLVQLLSAHTAPQPLPLDALIKQLWPVVEDEHVWPYMRLWLEIAALAAKGDGFFQDVGARLGRGFLAWGAAQLISPTPEQHASDTAKLLVQIEGMMVLKSIGLDDICARAL